MECVQEDAEKLSALAPHELVIKGYEVMAQYQLKPWQKDLIITDPELLEMLFRLHSEFLNVWTGHADGKSTTATVKFLSFGT